MLVLAWTPLIQLQKHPPPQLRRTKSPLAAMSCVLFELDVCMLTGHVWLMCAFDFSVALNGFMVGHKREEEANVVCRSNVELFS